MNVATLTCNESTQSENKSQVTMFKLLRELSRADAFGFHAAFDDEGSSSFSGFSESKNGVKIARRATIRDVQPGGQWSCKTQVLLVVAGYSDMEVIIKPKV